MSNALDKINESIKILNKSKMSEYEEDFDSVLKYELVNPHTYTISMFYVPETKKAHLIIKGRTQKCVTKVMTDSDYLRICETVGIYENNDYNLSTSMIVDGVAARIFAITKPISDYPNITISTSKNPPSEWHQAELSQMLKEIMDHNFVIVGASGAGKTFLMNFMLKMKHSGTTSKIAIIEEFNELIIPNDSTFRLSVPTAKPNQPRLLEFITEQSNLMRMDFLYVGEIKGSEAWPFLSNLSSGTIGAATLHGSSVRDGVNRFRDLCASSGASIDSINGGISKALNYVIYVRDRQIRHITKLTGTHQRGVFQMQDMFLHNSEEKQSKITGGVIRG